jgi:hypothetical protein
MENTIIMNNAETKVKKVSLNGQGVKYMAFGNWLIERQVASGLMTSESVTEARKLLAMFAGVEEQVEFYAKFASECKEHTKSVKAAIRQHNKPPPKAKAVKVVGDAEKKRGRKKKEVIAGEEDPSATLDAQLVAAAQGSGPIAPPVFIRGPKEPEIPQVVENKTENNTKNDVASFVNEMEAKVDEAKAAKAAKAAKPFEDELKKAAKATEAEAKKAAKAAEAEAKKAAKEAEAEAKKAAKEAEAEAKKAAKEAEAEAKKAAKAAEAEAKKAAKVADKNTKKDDIVVAPVLKEKEEEEEEEEEELVVETFMYDNVEYLKDADQNIYNRHDPNFNIIGKYDAETNTIKME